MDEYNIVSNTTPPSPGCVISGRRTIGERSGAPYGRGAFLGRALAVAVADLWGSRTDLASRRTSGEDDDRVGPDGIRGVSRHLTPATGLPAQPLEHEEKKKRRPSVALGLWIIKRTERALIKYSLVPDTPFLASSDFSWVRTLEADWKLIRAELDRLLEAPERIPNFQDISRNQYNITRDDKWKSYFLYGYGYKMTNNCKACPETTRILESIPDKFTAFFSVLAPGKHIPLHRGPYRDLLRCHLPDRARTAGRLLDRGGRRNC